MIKKTGVELDVDPIKKHSLSPFDKCDPGQQDWLVEALVQGITDLEIESDVYALETCEAFRPDMLAHVDQGLKAAKVLRKLLGRGEWSNWPWTVGQVVEGLAARASIRGLMASVNPEALQVYGELGELHQRLKPFRPS